MNCDTRTVTQTSTNIANRFVIAIAKKHQLRCFFAFFGLLLLRRQLTATQSARHSTNQGPKKHAETEVFPRVPQEPPWGTPSGDSPGYPRGVSQRLPWGITWGRAFW